MSKSRRRNGGNPLIGGLLDERNIRSKEQEYIYYSSEMQKTYKQGKEYTGLSLFVSTPPFHTP